MRLHFADHPRGDLLGRGFRLLPVRRAREEEQSQQQWQRARQAACKPPEGKFHVPALDPRAVVQIDSETRAGHKHIGQGNGQHHAAGHRAQDERRDVHRRGWIPAFHRVSPQGVRPLRDEHHEQREDRQTEPARRRFRCEINPHHRALAAPRHLGAALAVCLASQALQILHRQRDRQPWRKAQPNEAVEKPPPPGPRDFPPNFTPRRFLAEKPPAHLEQHHPRTRRFPPPEERQPHGRVIPQPPAGQRRGHSHRQPPHHKTAPEIPPHHGQPEVHGLPVAARPDFRRHRIKPHPPPSFPRAGNTPR